MKLKGKVAIVTGGAQGLGRAISIELAKEGANIVIGDVNEKGMEETAQDIKKIGRECISVKTDVSNQKEVSAMVNETLKKFARIDILVNNAGGSLNSPDSVEKTTADDWDRVISVNLTGTFNCCKAVLSIMKGNKGGKVVNISSKAGRTPGFISGPAYASAKAGILGLTRMLAYEMGPYGINVNAVAPGFTMTEPRFKNYFNSVIPKEKRDLIINTTPLRRTAEPEEIASVVSFLSSDDASFITGACIDANGGTFMV